MTTSNTSRPVSRRAALAGLGAGGLGMALSGRAGAATDPTPAPIRTDKFVVYGTVDGTDLILDVARPPDRSEPRPAIVLVHGGGLIDGTRFELADHADAIARAGYVTFNIDYRLCSQFNGTNPWPAQLDDVQRAVRWVRANAATYGVAPERVGALGWSSGGQLVGFLGTRETRDNSDPTLASFSSKVSCVVALAGNFDMTTPGNIPSETLIDIVVLGGTMEAPPSADAYRDYSPITFVDDKSAPFLIMQEGYDDVVPSEQAALMVAALRAARVQVSFGWFPYYTHFSWGQWPSSAPEALAFFGRHLQPER